MQLRGHQEALEKERKLEAAQKRAAEAARTLAASDRQAQDDVLSSLRGAASKLLQTQSEAARVTADAALQLTQVGDWWGCSKGGCLSVVVQLHALRSNPRACTSVAAFNRNLQPQDWFRFTFLPYFCMCVYQCIHSQAHIHILFIVI